jgi:Putative beta barrel porin-7 (BBP7)
VAIRATRYIGLTMVAMMSALLMGSVAAEDLPLPDPDGYMLPGESMLPESEEGMLPRRGTAANDFAESHEPSLLTQPPQRMHEQLSSELYTEGPVMDGSYPIDPHASNYEVNPAGYIPGDGQPAPIESSGTWLNRGIWYVETDVVVLHRIWQRNDVLLAAEDPNVNSPNFFPSGIPLNTNRAMYLQAAHPGEDAGVRATLGRFLFRDSHNRDHTLEFTAYSAGDWVGDHLLTSAAPNGLFVPFAVDGGNIDFDGSSLQRAIYSSRFNSFEMNYRMKKRLGRDQMVMDPNGYWRREASNGFNRNYLMGLRYLQMRETLDWTAEDILVNGADGRYLIHTGNDLIGFQMGEGIEYESGRWTVGISGKMALMVNDADSHSQLDFTASDTNDFNRRNTEDELSWLGEAHVLARYHVTPACSLRAGLDFLVLDSLALAPRQINFINGWSKVETGGNPYYLGGSLGFECYW